MGSKNMYMKLLVKVNNEYQCVAIQVLGKKDGN